ncbi:MULTISPECIES: LPS biosynthesis glycosyltransferase [Nostocales]|uniref:LPS biosynthesis glycosyltransferase n=1 Tax=Nostocales TaxID=1161 RepID=UPI0018F02824|nr:MULTISPECIES: LPS biosynthesis glycosyltransferase [Nostocales]
MLELTLKDKKSSNSQATLEKMLQNSEYTPRKSQKQTFSSLQIADVIGRAFIIAYKEQTNLLQTSLINEGLQCEVLRQKHQPQYKNFSPSYLCLLNHLRAWQIAARETQPTLIVEADFVPVVGFGKLPLPFNPNQTDVGMCWLYTCASQVYSVSADGYAEGFSVSTVAYIVTPQGAAKLINFAEELMKSLEPNAYSTWDTYLDNFLRRHQLKNYIPFRNYGEHGGLPNLEHSRHGLSKTHRADVLYNQLAFMPMYATNHGVDYFTFFSVRIQARIKGIGRLLTGKFLRLPILKRSTVPARLANFAIRRQFFLSI